jgi:hypothetical protein
LAGKIAGIGAAASGLASAPSSRPVSQLAIMLS